jgi:hypothetical protein
MEQMMALGEISKVHVGEYLAEITKDLDVPAGPELSLLAQGGIRCRAEKTFSGSINVSSKGTRVIKRIFSRAIQQDNTAIQQEQHTIK